MVNVGILKKANMIIHVVQAIWAVVLMGILMASLVADGPASGAAKYMFTMVSFFFPPNFLSKPNFFLLLGKMNR